MVSIIGDLVQYGTVCTVPNSPPFVILAIKKASSKAVRVLVGMYCTTTYCFERYEPDALTDSLRK